MNNLKVKGENQEESHLSTKMSQKKVYSILLEKEGSQTTLHSKKLKFKENKLC